jgi:hypothetical protein
MKMKHPDSWTKTECITEAKKFTNLKAWAKSSPDSYARVKQQGWDKACRLHMREKNIKWTKEKCLAEAKRFKSKAEWIHNSGSSYGASRRDGWIEECCAHMDSRPIQKTWSKAECLAIALTFASRKEWRLGSKHSYASAKKNGWFGICTEHMSVCSNGFWTKERCLTEASKYSSRKAWQAASQGSLSAAYKNHWMDEACKHMSKKMRISKWTFEICQNIASTFSSQQEWRGQNPASYHAAVKYGWYHSCCHHMETSKKQNNYWTRTLCKQRALDFKSRREWQYGCGDGSYVRARRAGWLEFCCSHMEDGRIKWTKAACLDDALRFETRISWKKHSDQAYKIAGRNGWRDESCQHMKNGRLGANRQRFTTRQLAVQQP